MTNLTDYYEARGFEVRISQRKRSDFVGEIGDFANQPAPPSTTAKPFSERSRWLAAGTAAWWRSYHRRR